MRPQTLLAAAARVPQKQDGLVNMPVMRASTLLFSTLEAFENIHHGDGLYPLHYARSGTPAMRALQEALAEIDGAPYAILTASGLSAIVVLLTALLNSGEHLLMTDSVYSSTRHFCDQELARLGVEVTYYDPLIGGKITELIRPNTKLVYCESPGSQTFEVQDVPAIATAAHTHGAVVALDNTWATPLFCRGADLGADISIHSCTKYIGGHADLVMGLLTCSAKYFPALWRTFQNIAPTPGADEIYLATRGLRTLAVRMQQHQETALRLAMWLKQRPEVVKVLHPALPECPGHEIWQRDFTGSSGLFSFVMKPYPRKALAAMLDDMQYFGMGFSWGGYESLLIPFRAHRTASPHWQDDGIALRLHAGLEDAQDLIADLEAGFKRLNKSAVL